MGAFQLTKPLLHQAGDPQSGEISQILSFSLRSKGFITLHIRHPNLETYKRGISLQNVCL